MSRSVKKGPFVEARLLGRIEEMNKRSEKKVVKTWSRASVIFRCSSRSRSRLSAEIGSPSSSPESVPVSGSVRSWVT